MLGIVTYSEDALARRKPFDFNLGSQDARFIVIQQFKQWNVSQFVGIAGHGFSPSFLKCGFALLVSEDSRCCTLL
jgi:hypothetical protein